MLANSVSPAQEGNLSGSGSLNQSLPAGQNGVAEPEGGIETRQLLDREIAARKVLESKLAGKERELQVLMREMQKIQVGGIKMLTDVLALARPEVFQKATKVQRWARRLAKKIKVEKPWELDLAAILYPLGVIALPDELALKYALAEPLSGEERRMIDESTVTAFKLLDSIPRMGGVAQAVLYCRKGFDGSGYPADGLAGMKLPQNARMLKILIDLTDASSGEGVTRADGFVTLASRKNEYDLEILRVAYIELLEAESSESETVKSLTLPVALLHPGDILLKDIVDSKNRLLLASGSELSEISIKRLKSLSSAESIGNRFLVRRGKAE